MAKSDLSGSLAVVTGGGGGIGRAVCSVLAREGCTVVVADLNQDNAEETVKLLTGSGHCSFSVNVVICQSVGSLFSTIKNRYNRLPNVVVNCAGIVIPKPILSLSDNDYENMFNVNVKGTFLVTQEACRCIIEEKLTGGSIITISSQAARKANSNTSLYSATKGAVESFTRAAALEMAPHGIRVNCVSPGPVNTLMIQNYAKLRPEDVEWLIQNTALGRLAEPEEIGEICAFLASPKSSYMTGAVVPVSGGYGI